MEATVKKILYIGSCILILVAATYPAAETEHAMAVTVLKADLSARKVVTRTADGTEQIFRFTAKTPVTSLAEAAMSRSLSGGEGYQFIIHYTVERGEKVAVAFDYVGREAWKKISGTVIKTDAAARTVTVRTQEGKEETFFAGEHCATETSQGAKSFRDWARTEADGENEVTVRFTEVKGRKVAHLFEYAETQKISAQVLNIALHGGH